MRLEVLCHAFGNCPLQVVVAQNHRLGGAARDTPPHGRVDLKGRAQEAADLRDAPVCVAQGSGYASTVAQRFGARPRSYPSSVHAASAFTAGECQALVEDSEILYRLLPDEEWHF